MCEASLVVSDRCIMYVWTDKRQIQELENVKTEHSGPSIQDSCVEQSYPYEISILHHMYVHNV